MEDGFRLRSQSDPSVTNSRFDSKVKGEKRSLEVGRESEAVLTSKRVKMRDLDSIFSSEGIETHHSEFSKSKEFMDRLHLHEKEEMSQITREPITMIPNSAQSSRTKRNTSPFFEDAASLRLARDDPAPNPVDLNIRAHSTNEIAYDATPANVDDTTKQFFIVKHDKDREPNLVNFGGIGLDLNLGVSSSVDQDPFHPYKIPSHVKSIDASECGSSTGPLEENDSLRLWKEMKQNGFLSSLHGGIPVPKRRVRKTKSDVLKKRMELAKREQINRFTKIAAPSGLLNGLNPGIINNVRNRKQVHSIIEALVRSEKLENESLQSKEASQMKKGAKDINARKDQESVHYSRSTRFILSKEEEHPNTLSGNRQNRGCRISSGGPKPMSSKHKGEADDSCIMDRRVCGETSDTSHTNSDHEDDTPELKLSSSTMVSENTSAVSNEESLNQASISSLSVKAATVASQWLELLHQDIRGRLAGLRRSKKRVRAVIQTELPFLVSKEFPSNKENNPNSTQSSASGYPNSATPEMHRARWTALFDQMDVALSEEGKHLESWLNQVKEMQLHCEQGLQCVNWTAANGLQQLDIPEMDSRSKKADNSERELAIRAAAASIYSTCNFALSTDNVSCS